MDKRTFIVELVKAVAWPASMLLIFWIMKDNIRKLFSSIRKLKHGDTEFAFEETLSEAKSEAEQAGLPASQIPCLLYTSPSPRDGLLSRMPSSA